MIRNGAAERSSQQTIGGKNLVNRRDHVTLRELDDHRPKPKKEPRGNDKIATCMQSPDESQLWCPGPSLWNLIAEHVIGTELPKIRSSLGHSLVDMYVDLHSEAEMWHKMWQQSQQGNSSSRPGTKQPQQLDDPPAIKELVKAEVKMLVETLREKASFGWSTNEELAFHFKPELVEYVLGNHKSGSRNLKETGNKSRSWSQCSVRSIAEDEIEAVRDKLNVFDIEQVVGRLKSVLTEECEALKNLVKHLKENIKGRCRTQHDRPEPTLKELTDCRGTIQRHLGLYPSSHTASTQALSAVKLKEPKNRSSLSAVQRGPEKTLRPHLLPPLHITNPRPLPSPPLTQASASLKKTSISSLSQIHGEHKGASVSNEPNTKQTQLCNSNKLWSKQCTAAASLR